MITHNMIYYNMIYYTMIVWKLPNKASKQLNPHPRMPAARLFFVIQCFLVVSSTWGNPEVGYG